MRTREFNDIDDAITELAIVLANHMGGTSLLWGYSKNKVLTQFAEHYVSTVDYIIHNLSSVFPVNISPIQFLKIAYRYSLASKRIICNKELVSKNFLKLFNCATKKQRQIEDYYSSLIEQKGFICCNTSDKKILSYINADIRALSELLYCDEHTVGGQTSGPYNNKDGSLIIHDYLRLCPEELFPQISFSVQRIISACVYSDSTIEADLYGNITSSKSPVETITKYLVQVTLVNGEILYLDSSSLPQLLKYLDELIEQINMEYHKLRDYDLWKLTLSCEYYALKPLLDCLEKKWWPFTENVLLAAYSSKDMLHSEITGKDNSDECEEDLVEISKRIIDPRI